MSTTVLLTGATDGIGLETARMLVSLGHDVLVHGRDASKVAAVERELSAICRGQCIESYVADLSRLSDVEKLASEVVGRHPTLNVLINNAGVYTTRDTVTPDGLDVRFAVNTVAPYLLTKRLLPLLGPDGRVVNLSSAAQAPVDLQALAHATRMSDGAAYAQSKLALTMWSRALADSLGDSGPVVVAVNPGSLLATKMVREGFGVAGSDVRIGADVVTQAALADTFATANGQYFDNDTGRFAPPHPDGLDPRKIDEVVRSIEAVLADMS